MKENYSTRDYDDFIRNSTHGNRTRRETRSQFVSRERYNDLKQEANLKIKRWMIIALATGVIGFTGGYVANDIVHETIPNYVAGVRSAAEYKEDSASFRSEFISNNVHRTDDYQHFWYDYPRIYEGLNSFGDGDYDKNVFYAYRELGPKYTSELLDYSRNDPNHDYCLIIKNEDGESESRSFRNYLYKNGYYEEGTDIYDDKAYEEAIENFSNTMESRFEIEYAFEEKQRQFNDEQNERKSELDQMMNEHNMSGPNNTSKGGK